MAGAAPDPDDNNEFFKRGRLEHDISFDENSLDGEERQVVQETETIFRTFLYTRLISDIERDSEDGDLNAAEIPGTVIDSIRHEQSDMEKKEDDMENDPKIIELGRILATLGDEVYKKYDFPGIVDGMKLEEEFAYSSFTNVARKLFQDGVCNWGRIVSLFLFGYEIASRFIRQGSAGIRSFLKRIMNYVIGFICKERITKWIIEQGGWIKFQLQENSEWLNKSVVALLVAAVAFGIYKYARGGSS